MKRVISFFLCAIMLMLSAHTVLATEITDISYNTLSVEFSDNLGTTEDLKAMVTEDHFYVDAEQLGDRLGYQVEVGNEYVAIYNKSFSNTVPYGITAFYYDSTKVRHMLFNKMVDYEAPFKIVKNSDGVWIPFEFSLLLLNSSDVVLNNQVHIEMPQKNIIDIYMDILKNNDRYLFDWKSDAGASDGSIFAMGTGAYFVQVFSGILDKDGASWLQLIDSFNLKMDSYDRKYAESFARMFCTYSDEELTLNAKAMKEKMKPFNGDNWVAKSIKKVDDIIDDNIGDLSEKTADLKKKIDVENGISVAKFNKSYQELDKMCNTADYFSDMTDPFLTASKEFKNVTSFLDVFYKISEVIGYASEFKNQDEFAVKSLDILIKNSDSSCVMSKAMKDSMGDYKKTLETDIVAYSAYNYLMNNMTDLFTDTIDISTTILDMDSKLYLLAWDIAKGAIPLVKNSLSNTDCFLQSMYAGIIQSDTFSTYINKRNVVFGDAKNITPENLYELSQYCYAYLKSCYITRDAAVGSLTEKTKKNNPTYESTQKMVNQEIAKCLVKLKDADKTNKYGCYGFLPENNKQYLSEYDDGTLIQCVVSDRNNNEINETNSIYVEFLNNAGYKKYISDDWLYGDPSQYAIFDIDGNGTNELLILGNDNEWYSLEIFTVDSENNQIILIPTMNYASGEPTPIQLDSVSSYCGFNYSKKYHALVYRDVNNGADGDFYSYDIINNGCLENDFGIGYQTDFGSGQTDYYLWELNSEKKTISNSEFDSYVSEYTSIEWKPLPNVQGADSTPQGQNALSGNKQNISSSYVDGFWHSTDGKYAFYIYTHSQDNGFGTLYYINLPTNHSDAIHGQVKKVSDSSVILQTMGCKPITPELFAVDGKLVSDDLTLEKIDESISANLLGNWSDGGDRSYTFKDDGSYTFHAGEKNGRSGKYFIIDDKQIAFGNSITDMQTYTYSLKDNTLIINDFYTYTKE